MKNHNYEKAKVCFKQVLAIDPENKNAAEMYDYLVSE